VASVTRDVNYKQNSMRFRDLRYLITLMVRGRAVITGSSRVRVLVKHSYYLEAGREEDSLGDSESNTMERLRDGQVKLVAVRYEHHAGSQRRIVNQMRTGTMSRHTRLNVPKRRSDHL
jgi:hypothetical protein